MPEFPKAATNQLLAFSFVLLLRFIDEDLLSVFKVMYWEEEDLLDSFSFIYEECGLFFNVISFFFFFFFVVVVFFAISLGRSRGLWRFPG